MIRNSVESEISKMKQEKEKNTTKKRRHTQTLIHIFDIEIWVKQTCDPKMHRLNRNFIGSRFRKCVNFEKI